MSTEWCTIQSQAVESEQGPDEEDFELHCVVSTVMQLYKARIAKEFVFCQSMCE